jgi:F-type H+-transporting ATPase subunit a
MKEYFNNLYAKTEAYLRAHPRQTTIIASVVVLLLLSLVIRVPQPHVSLASEPLLENGPAWFTNTLLTTFVVDIILLVLVWFATHNMSLIPSGLQNVVEAILEFLYNLAESIAGKAASTYFPWSASIFLFLLICNWTDVIPGVGSIGIIHTIHAGETRMLSDQLAMAGGKLMLVKSAAVQAAAAADEKELVPLFRPPSTDLNLTFALAISTMILVQYYGVKAFGGSYFNKFFPWKAKGEGWMKGINGFVIILELISELSRILTFAFRLFGNIFAGEVVLATLAFLVTFLVPIPFYGLEVMVGVIQAFVFTMLSLIFFSMATISHGGDHQEGAEQH